jgi:hypothetical protein
MKIMVAVFRLASAISFVLISTISQAQESEMPTSIDFDVGERWEWARINNETKKPEWNFFRTVVSQNGTKLFFDGKNNTPITQTFLGGNSEKPSRVWPIKIGKKWDYKNEFTSADGTLVITSQRVEVLSFEEVTVTAGKFMAYKIAYRGTFRNSRGTGAMNETYWYAPSLKADVKYISEDGKDYFYQRELITYSIKF